MRLNNFTAFMAIYGGMNMASISRLKLTMAAAHESSLKKLEKLSEIADPVKSFSNYRKILRTAEVPCIPYLYVPSQCALIAALLTGVGARI